jgi:hypothetical protein
MEPGTRVQGFLGGGTSAPVSGSTFGGMSRLRKLLALLSLVGAVVVLGGCGGAGALEPVTLDELTQAASASAEAPSGRFDLSLEMTYTGLATPFQFTGKGAYDTAADRAALTFDLSAIVKLFGGLVGGQGAGADLSPDAWRIEAIQDGTVVYMRFPAIADQLPAGKTWVRVDAEETARSAGIELSGLEQFTDEDPRALLDFLKAVSGEIEVVGSEELRGVTTTHYRATIDLRHYEQLVPPSRRKEVRDMLGDFVQQAGLTEMPFDVWLDDDGYVRKVETSFSASPEGVSGAAEASMVFELYDYGAEVGIVPPPAADVADVSALGG